MNTEVALKEGEEEGFAKKLQSLMGLKRQDTIIVEKADNMYTTNDGYSIYSVKCNLRQSDRDVLVKNSRATGKDVGPSVV